MDELSSISPDTWLNIPPPLKDAVRLLLKHVLSLHSRFTFTYAEMSQTHAKVKDLQSRTREDHSLLESMNARHREEVVKLEEANAACVKLTKEMVDLMESSERRKGLELSDLKARLKDAESFTKETQKSLWNGMKKFEADLTAKFAHFRLEAKGEIRSDLQRDLNPLRESLVDFQLHTDCAVEGLNSSFLLWTKQCESLQESRKRTTEEEFEAVQRAIEAVKGRIETQIATVRQEIRTEMVTFTEEMQNKARKESLLMAGKGNLSFGEVEKVKKDLETAVNALKQDFTAFQLAISKTETQPLTPLWTEIHSIHHKLQAELETKSSFLAGYMQESCTALEERILEQVDQRIETQLRDIRAKLAVSTIQWLPLNLADVAGMAPTEARLYTLEARQRTEENKNIKRHQSLQEQLQGLKDLLADLQRKREKQLKDLSLELPQATGLSKGLVGKHTPAEDLKPRSLSPLTRQPFSSAYVKKAGKRPTDRLEATITAGQKNVFSSPVTPPAAPLSRLSDHETVKFEKLIERNW